MKRNFVVAMTGASGVAYARRLVEVFCAAGCDVHLSISPAAQAILKQELDLSVDLEHFDPASLMLDAGSPPRDEKLRWIRSAAGISSEASNVLSVASGEPGQVRYHHYLDFTAPIASGSFVTHGMVVCPCSG